MQNKTWFERAIFLNWYCSKGDCKFCYMSTQKSRIKDPKLARRSTESIVAEALICKACGWKIEFLSGGYEGFDAAELVEITKKVYEITGQKQWLNIGFLSKNEIEKFAPYIEGICGAVECVNPDVHDKVCPSKPVSEIINMFDVCNNLNLKKAMTLIVGIGETEKNIPLLLDFIKKNGIYRITFYRLNPHKGTAFTEGPSTNYYLKWISAVRKEFQDIEIVAGSWVDKVKEISLLLGAGADAITKFPSIKLFNSEFAKEIESQARLAGREFVGTLTKLPETNWKEEIWKLDLDENLKQRVFLKVNEYIKQMR